MSARTTGPISTRGVRAVPVLLCFLGGYGVAAIEQAVIGTPWPKAVHIESAQSHAQSRMPARETVVEHDCGEKRVEKLL